MAEKDLSLPPKAPVRGKGGGGGGGKAGKDDGEAEESAALVR